MPCHLATNRRTTTTPRTRRRPQRLPPPRRLAAGTLLAAAAIAASPLVRVSHSLLLPAETARTRAAAVEKATPLSASAPGRGASGNAPRDETLELLREVPFVPEEVLAGFLSSVGETMTAANLRAGYEAGAVGAEELDAIAAKMPGLAVRGSEPLSVMSVERLAQSWSDALAGQPWHVRNLGNLAGPAVVGLVAKLQERAVSRANAMAWVNREALALVRANATVVELLSADGGAGTAGLRLNNTRARFEPDRGVWSASMDVFDENGILATTASGSDDEESRPPSDAEAALEALLAEDAAGGDLSSFRGTVGVVPGPETEALAPARGSPVGLVNAYFVPGEEIRILVVEIDGVLHNVTWKGLDR